MADNKDEREKKNQAYNSTLHNSLLIYLVKTTRVI